MNIKYIFIFFGIFILSSCIDHSEEQIEYPFHLFEKVQTVRVSTLESNLVDSCILEVKINCDSNIEYDTLYANVYVKMNEKSDNTYVADSIIVFCDRSECFFRLNRLDFSLTSSGPIDSSFSFMEISKYPIGQIFFWSQDDWYVYKYSGYEYYDVMNFIDVRFNFSDLYDQRPDSMYRIKNYSVLSADELAKVADILSNGRMVVTDDD